MSRLGYGWFIQFIPSPRLLLYGFAIKMTSYCNDVKRVETNVFKAEMLRWKYAVEAHGMTEHARIRQDAPCPLCDMARRRWTAAHRQPQKLASQGPCIQPPDGRDERGHAAECGLLWKRRTEDHSARRTAACMEVMERIGEGGNATSNRLPPAKNV